MLDRYKQLVEAALAVTHATACDGPENVLRLLNSRAIIEQAKGAIIAATGVTSSQAWLMLRETSQHHNVKLRDIAVALIEYLGNEPAKQPALTDRAAPALTSLFGVGDDCAAELLLVVGENPERIHSEAALAKLCGAWPSPPRPGRPPDTASTEAATVKQTPPCTASWSSACDSTNPPSPTSTDA